jgi:hypothetical protein
LVNAHIDDRVILVGGSTPDRKGKVFAIDAYLNGEAILWDGPWETEAEAEAEVEALLEADEADEIVVYELNGRVWTPITHHRVTVVQ